MWSLVDQFKGDLIVPLMKKLSELWDTKSSLTQKRYGITNLPHIENVQGGDLEISSAWFQQEDLALVRSRRHLGRSKQQWRQGDYNLEAGRERNMEINREEKNEEGKINTKVTGEMIIILFFLKVYLVYFSSELESSNEKIRWTVFDHLF